MKKNAEKELRRQALYLLTEGGAHAGFDEAVRGLPPALRGKKVKGSPYSAWMLLEHLRLAQWDILEFSRNPKHKSEPWPSGYWPKSSAPPSASAWDKSVKAFQRDLQAMAALVRNPKANLFTPFAWGDGQTLLREALLLADHNAYHVGELVLLRRLLGAWKKSA